MHTCDPIVSWLVQRHLSYASSWTAIDMRGGKNGSFGSRVVVWLVVRSSSRMCVWRLSPTSRLKLFPVQIHTVVVSPRIQDNGFLENRALKARLARRRLNLLLVKIKWKNNLILLNPIQTKKV